jgi:putative phosphoribosyl transferase
MTAPASGLERKVLIPADTARLEGEFALPGGATGIVLFAHGSGSSRLSPRNTQVARTLNRGGIGTLLFDLLTRQEDRDYETRFDIGLLTMRLLAATEWAAVDPSCSGLKIGYFGASTGAAAALEAAAAHPAIAAVVARGGRPDLARAPALEKVRAPTLLLVGSLDGAVIELNERAFAHLACVKNLVIVPGASHLFEEPGTLDQVATHATQWFRRWLT